MKKQKKQNLKMRNWVKIHAVFTALLFIFYVAVGTLVGLDMLGEDMRQKFAQGATAISVFINGVPGKPILSVTTACVNDVSTVNLSWSESEWATSYSISRNGHTLASDFQAMEYVNDDVVSGNKYDYIVIAKGGGDDAPSDMVSVHAKECGDSELPEPSLRLVSFDGKDVSNGVLLSTTNDEFKITGTTNMSDAKIKISTLPGPIFTSTMNANENGYWKYYLPGKLPVGSYAFRITATDPDDSSRSVTKKYLFRIMEKNDGSVDAVPSEDVPVSSDQDNEALENIQESDNKDAGSMTVRLLNENGKVYRGQDISLEIIFSGMGNLFDDSNGNTVNLKYEIINDDGGIVFVGDVTKKVFEKRLKDDIVIPDDMELGNYDIRISMFDEKKILTAESPFVYAERPLVTLGGAGYTRTQILSQLGWLVVIVMSLFIFVGFIFLLEYYFFQRAMFTVTEDDLARHGMISGW